MSAFTKLTKETEEIEKNINEFKISINKIQNEMKEGINDEKKVELLNQIKGLLGNGKILNEKLITLQPQVNKFEEKANEKDPDKILFGPTMVEKVKQFVVKFLELNQNIGNSIEDLEKLKGEFGGIEEREEAEKRKIEERKIQQQREEEEAKKREEERILKEKMEQEEKQKQLRELEEKKKREEEERKKREAEEIERKKRLEEEEENRRVALAEKMTFEGSIEMLKEGVKQVEGNNSDRKMKQVLLILHELLKNIALEPSEIRFRQLRKNNASLQNDFFKYSGALECLYSLGFRGKRMKLDNKFDDFYYLEEPGFDDQDEWMIWFDRLKDSKEFLEDMLKIRK